MDNCIFCKIAAGEIPAKLVYQDADMVAFHDINPAAPMHVLIVPREHIASLATGSESHAPLLGKMMLLAPKLAQELGHGVSVAEDGTHSGGFKTTFHVGPAGGQEIYHLHLHLIGGPRPWRAPF